MDLERTICKTVDREQTFGKTVCGGKQSDIVPALNIPSLPDGKDKYFFVSYSSDDSERVYSYVEELEQRFNLSCVYAERDFQAGKDIAENVKDGMARSLKILLFLSPNFHASPWCRFEREFAFITSIENGVNCVIPVMLEKCEVPTTLVSLTYVDATSQDVDVAQRITSALIQTFSASGFLPQNLTSALSSYENGYTFTLAAERPRTCCICRPARYRFKTATELYSMLKQHKIEIPASLLEKSVRLINRSSIMWSYDYLKRSNILLWFLLSMPFFFLLFVFILSLQILSQTTKFPLSDEESFDRTQNFWIIVVFYNPAVFLLLLIMFCCIPRCCRRHKKYTALQRQLWELYADEYLKHNVLVIFSSRENAPLEYVVQMQLSVTEGNCFWRERGSVEFPKNRYLRLKPSEFQAKSQCQKNWNSICVLETTKSDSSLYGDKKYLGKIDNEQNLSIKLFIMRYNISSCKEYLERIIKDKYPTMDKVSTEVHANFMIKDHLSEILPHLVDDFDSLPEAPYNRHNVRKGKMCLCQRLEQVV